MEVCGAIQHAHHKVIIHRDLKTRIVIVMSHDDKAVPKVIDFVVATGLRSVVFKIADFIMPVVLGEIARCKNRERQEERESSRSCEEAPSSHGRRRTREASRRSAPRMVSHP